MENLMQRWKQLGPFSLKSGHFFRFSKRIGKAIPFSSSCAPVSVTEYASVSLNMHKYFQISSVSEYGKVAYAKVTQSSEYVSLWLYTPQ